MPSSTPSSLCLLLALLLAVTVQGFFLAPARLSSARARQPSVSAAGTSVAPVPQLPLSPLYMSQTMNEEPLILTEENAEMVLQQAREELGTMFGYLDENKAVGITGEVDLVAVEGISIIVRLRNRFWHDKRMVLARVSKYLTDRIPEAMVEIEDEKQLEGDDAKSVSDFYKH